jgi:hypothetical protein
MSVFGVSEPVVIGILALIAIIIYVASMMFRRRLTTDYSNFDIRHSVAYFHFAGVVGPGYANLQLKEPPIIHGNGKATLHLETLPRAFNDVCIDKLSKECNYKIKDTAENLFGTRVDIYLNIDANGNKQQWDNVLVQNWDMYVDRFSKSAKSKVLMDRLLEKEFDDEIKAASTQTSGTGVPSFVGREMDV